MARYDTKPRTYETYKTVASVERSHIPPWLSPCNIVLFVERKDFGPYDQSKVARLGWSVWTQRLESPCRSQRKGCSVEYEIHSSEDYYLSAELQVLLYRIQWALNEVRYQTSRTSTCVTSEGRWFVVTSHLGCGRIVQGFNHKGKNCFFHPHSNASIIHFK